MFSFYINDAFGQMFDDLKSRDKPENVFKSNFSVYLNTGVGFKNYSFDAGKNTLITGITVKNKYSGTGFNLPVSISLLYSNHKSIEYGLSFRFTFFNVIAPKSIPEIERRLRTNTVSKSARFNFLLHYSRKTMMYFPIEVGVSILFNNPANNNISLGPQFSAGWGFTRQINGPHSIGMTFLIPYSFYKIETIDKYRKHHLISLEYTFAYRYRI